MFHQPAKTLTEISCFNESLYSLWLCEWCSVLLEKKAGDNKAYLVKSRLYTPHSQRTRHTSVFAWLCVRLYTRMCRALCVLAHVPCAHSASGATDWIRSGLIEVKRSRKTNRLYWTFSGRGPTLLYLFNPILLSLQKDNEPHSRQQLNAIKRPDGLSRTAISRGHMVYEREAV